MPLYGGVGGAQKELNLFYAGVGGAAKQLDMLYGGVGGSAKELLASGYKWKKYAISSTPAFEYVTTAESAYTTYSSGYTMIMYAKALNKITWTNNNVSSGAVSFTTSNCDGVQVAQIYNGLIDSEYVGYYVPLKDDYSLKTYNNTSAGDQATSCGYILKITGRPGSGSYLIGEVYKPVMQIGDYISTESALDIGTYPINGYQDGYWYVYDGDITWNKYVLNEIYEPSAYNAAESFSSSQSYPLLMASQAKKDGNGNVDWGTTYSASSASNLRSNYSKYPFCSFASTLNADNLYKITTASILSYKRQKVSAWSLTSQSAGDLVGSVKGKYGDYPEDGIQDGYWYIMQEIV